MCRRSSAAFLLIGIHFLTLEMGARMFGMNEPGIGVYRPNDNPVIDWLQTWGRLRSNKDMIDRGDLKGMIRALKKGDVVWYAPDHDYGPTASVFAPLFAVDQAATTSGTWMLAKMSKACIVPFVPRRKPDGKGYELIILPPECSPPLDDAETTAAWMNKIVEQCIMMAPEQYMWLHRRFKTRPEGMPSPLLIPFPAAHVAGMRSRSCFRLCFSFKSSPPLRHLFPRRIISRLIFSLNLTCRAGQWNPMSSADTPINWKQNLTVTWLGCFLTGAAFSLVMPFLPLYVEQLRGHRA